MQKLLKATAAILCAVGIGLTSGGFTSTAGAAETLPQAPAPTIISKSGDIGSVTVVADESQTDKYGPLQYCWKIENDQCQHNYWTSKNEFETDRTSPADQSVRVLIRFRGNEKFSAGSITSTDIPLTPLPEIPHFTAKYKQPLAEIKLPAPWKLVPNQGDLYYGQRVVIQREWLPLSTSQNTSSLSKDVKIGPSVERNYYLPHSNVARAIGYARGNTLFYMAFPDNEFSVPAKLISTSRIENWSWPNALPTADVEGEATYKYACVQEGKGYFHSELVPNHDTSDVIHHGEGLFSGEYIDCSKSLPDAPGKWTLVTFMSVDGLYSKYKDKVAADQINRIYWTPFTIPDSKASTSANTNATKPSETSSQPSKDNNGGSGGGIFAFLGIALIPLIFVILKAVGIPLPF